MGNQKDLFDGTDTGASEATKTKNGTALSTGAPTKPQAGPATAEPPHFAPMSAEFGDALPLGRYASLQYLQYAVSTVKDRALPRVGDGQKPVQARILYAMWEMGGRPGTPRKKSARVVGDVLGKFHPHGDASVYDALVRIAQDFTMRYPLVDGEGNFGSRDGDDAAAMRYTEARLTRFARVARGVGQRHGGLRAHHDGSLNEPQVLRPGCRWCC